MSDPNKPKFCFVCGSPLKMRYPGGDPENGPATPRCKENSHQNVSDVVNEEIARLDVDELFEIVRSRARDSVHYVYPPIADRTLEADVSKKHTEFQNTLTLAQLRYDGFDQLIQEHERLNPVDMDGDDEPPEEGDS